MYQQWWLLMPILPSILVIVWAPLGDERHIKHPPTPRDSRYGAGQDSTWAGWAPSLGQQIYAGRHRAETEC